MTRSDLLYAIELALINRHGIDLGRIDTIPKLRSALPSYRKPLDIEGLKSLLRSVQRCDMGSIEKWRIKPKKGPKKLKISIEQVEAMRSDGISVICIAKAAGVKSNRIYTILKGIV